MSDLLSIGLQGLIAFQNSLVVSGQNIANANTPGYNRRLVNLVEGEFYNGVYVGDVQRVFDQASVNNMRTCTSSYNFSNTLYTFQQALEPLFDNAQNNVGVYINKALDALRDLNSDVSSVPSRNVFLSGLNQFASRMNAVDLQLQTEIQNSNQALLDMTQAVNLITESIAALNTQIASAPQGTDLSPLEDARDEYVNQLTTYINCTAVVDSTNQIDITIGNGTQLVLGPDAYQLQANPDPTNSQNLNMFVAGTDGNVSSAIGLITGGQIGATLAYRDQTVTPARVALGRLSLCIADQLNSQNKLGMTISPNMQSTALGNDLFTDINASNQQNLRAIANLNNTGNESLTVTIDDTNLLTTYNYTLEFSSPTEYTLTRDDGTVVGSGTVTSLPLTISADGFTTTINSGTINAGDSFVISPTAGAASLLALQSMDPSTLALAWPVSAQPSQTNTGQGGITVTEMTDTTTSAFSTPGQLNPPIEVQFLSDNTYQLVDMTTNTVIEGPITYDPSNGAIFPTPNSYDPGYRVTLSGTPQAGDTFTITYNSNGVGDNRNGQAMADLFDQANTVADGTMTFIEAYNLLSGNVSLATSQSGQDYQSTFILYTQAQASNDQISGVSLQEEAVNMARYQQAYQASAQILEVARTVFDSIIQLLR